MCGFVGIFSPKGLSPDKHKLEKLTNLIHHRGPNENGYFIDDKINLGFKRLSIIDLKNGSFMIYYQMMIKLMMNINTEMMMTIIMMVLMTKDSVVVIL